MKRENCICFLWLNWGHGVELALVAIVFLFFFSFLKKIPWRWLDSLIKSVYVPFRTNYLSFFRYEATKNLLSNREERRNVEDPPAACCNKSSTAAASTYYYLYYSVEKESWRHFLHHIFLSISLLCHSTRQVQIQILVPPGWPTVLPYLAAACVTERTLAGPALDGLLSIAVFWQVQRNFSAPFIVMFEKEMEEKHCWEHSAIACASVRTSLTIALKCVHTSILGNVRQNEIHQIANVLLPGLPIYLSISTSSSSFPTLVCQS